MRERKEKEEEKNSHTTKTPWQQNPDKHRMIKKKIPPLILVGCHGFSGLAKLAESESPRAVPSPSSPYKQRKWFPGNKTHMKVLLMVLCFLSFPPLSTFHTWTPQQDGAPGARVRFIISSEGRGHSSASRIIIPVPPHNSVSPRMAEVMSGLFGMGSIPKWWDKS